MPNLLMCSVLCLLLLCVVRLVFGAHQCCECQGMKLVKCTELTSLWKYRKKQRQKVRYYQLVNMCL